MPEEKEGSSEFKVVDKRAFREDGQVRQEAHEETWEPEPPLTPLQAEIHPATPEAPAMPEADSGGFEGVVQFLGATTMFQLGLMQGPGGERMPADFVSAHHTIDMLEVLQRKTRGNLTPAETSLLEDVLYELRMSFVELEKHLANKSK